MGIVILSAAKNDNPRLSILYWGTLTSPNMRHLAAAIADDAGCAGGGTQEVEEEAAFGYDGEGGAGAVVGGEGLHDDGGVFG